MKYLVMMMLVAMSACGHNHYEYFEGAPGKDGAQGEVGPQGPQGAPGIDGTSVTVVKLCPGVTTYPSKFVEIAFCIGGKLYATYSANGGFSSEFPIGYYSSSGINSSCNFSVLADCVIHN